MVRVLGITFAAIVGLVITMVVGTWALLMTPLGASIVDDISRPIIERQVKQQLNADIDYGEIIGPLPGQLVIRDVVLSTEGDVWFKSDRLIVAWNPWALLRGELSIDRVVIDGSTLHRLPDLPDRVEPLDDEQPETPREGSIFPVDVNLRAFVIDDFVLGPDVLGEEYRFSLQSELRVLRPRLRITLHAETDQGRDELFLAGDVDRKGADVNIILVSETDGAFALASKADDRLELRLRIAGDYSELQAEIAAAMGRYGQLTGSAARFPEQNNALRTDLVYQPGAILSNDIRQLLGEDVTLSGQLVEQRGRADIEIQELTGAFGTLAGVVEGQWQNRRRLNVDIDGQLTEAALTAYSAGDLAGEFSLTAEIREKRRGFDLAGTLSAGSVSVSIEDGTSKDNVLFDGSVAIAASSLSRIPESVLPVLEDGANAAAKITLTDERALSVKNFSVVLGQETEAKASAQGDLQFDLETSSLDTDLNVRIEPVVLDEFLDSVAADKALTLDVSAQGTLDNLAVALNGAIPGGTYRGNAVDHGTLNLSMTGLPLRPSGSISLTSDGGYEMEVLLTSADDWVRIENVDARFGAITMKAAGQFNHQNGDGSGSLSLDAGDRSRLITGQLVSGRLSVDVSHLTSEDLVRAAIAADDLRLDDNAIGTLIINASGPPETIGFDVTASDVAAQDLFLYGLTTSGTLSMGSVRSVAINDFVLRLSDSERNPREISLVRPTKASWGDGIVLSPTRIAWLDDGVVTANAAISKDAWVAQIAAQRIVVPGTDTYISAQLNLDTSDTDPASFQVVAATEGKNDRYAVRTDGRWTGREVLTEGVIIRSGRERLGSFDAAVPLLLERRPTLGVTLPDAPMEGTLEFDDSFAPILAFFPGLGEPVSGQLKAEMTINGLISDPAIRGQMVVTETRFEDPEVGITALGVNGDIAFEGQGSVITAELDLTGSGREGRADAVRLSGTIDTSPDNAVVDLRLITNRAQLARNAELELRVTSDLALAGDLNEVTLSGPITIDELDFAIPDTEGGSNAPTFVPVNIVRTDVPETEEAAVLSAPEEAPPILVNLDLNVEARNGVFVRGRGLESEWAIDLEVQGTNEDPTLRGSVSSLDGTLVLAGRSFALTEGLVSFTPETSLDPTLDVQAETITGTAPDEVTAIARVSGPSSQPTISFSSNPSLPEEDVLALILFGRPATELGAAEALQLAQAAATLSGTGPFGGAGMANALRSGLGLDRLSYDAEGQSLTVGKYIADDVYVSAVQGIGEVGTAFSVIYEVSRFFSLETTLKSNGAQALSGNYKRDY
ncbi:MAG: translocation/assembly module TamB domain-containing protein [Pseudomonadota bacterium]